MWFAVFQLPLIISVMVAGSTISKQQCFGSPDGMKALPAHLVKEPQLNIISPISSIPYEGGIKSAPGAPHAWALPVAQNPLSASLAQYVEQAEIVPASVKPSADSSVKGNQQVLAFEKFQGSSKFSFRPKLYDQLNLLNLHKTGASSKPLTIPIQPVSTIRCTSVIPGVQTIQGFQSNSVVQFTSKSQLIADTVPHLKTVSSAESVQILPKLQPILQMIPEAQGGVEFPVAHQVEEHMEIPKLQTNQCIRGSADEQIIQDVQPIPGVQTNQDIRMIPVAKPGSGIQVASADRANSKAVSEISAISGDKGVPCCQAIPVAPQASLVITDQGVQPIPGVQTNQDIITIPVIQPASGIQVASVDRVISKAFSENSAISGNKGVSCCQAIPVAPRASAVITDQGVRPTPGVQTNQDIRVIPLAQPASGIQVASVDRVISKAFSENSAISGDKGVPCCKAIPVAPRAGLAITDVPVTFQSTAGQLVDCVSSVLNMIYEIRKSPNINEMQIMFSKKMAENGRMLRTACQNEANKIKVLVINSLLGFVKYELLVPTDNSQGVLLNKTFQALIKFKKS